ncbi:hypothetical protein [Geotalea sp. SG265]|uniref:hypothetical protein n=1 Tax=Geotalea sp. SG265 TaxID=2922867 RepID=UPI001FAEC360|nr:hypothetical protein [Geotalea sp. SG265]
MAIDAYLPYILALNILLTILDATIGYHAAPSLVRTGAADEESRAAAAKTIRSMLALVVALYSFFSCLAFSRQNLPLLLILTAVIVVDMVAQVILLRKMKNRSR